jgi:hypothetical protein
MLAGRSEGDEGKNVQPGFCVQNRCHRLAGFDLLRRPDRYGRPARRQCGSHCLDERSGATDEKGCLAGEIYSHASGIRVAPGAMGKARAPRVIMLL